MQWESSFTRMHVNYEKIFQLSGRRQTDSYLSCSGASASCSTLVLWRAAMEWDGWERNLIRTGDHMFSHTLGVVFFVQWKCQKKRGVRGEGKGRTRRKAPSVPLEWSPQTPWDSKKRNIRREQLLKQKSSTWVTTRSGIHAKHSLKLNSLLVDGETSDGAIRCACRRPQHLPAKKNIISHSDPELTRSDLTVSMVTVWGPALQNALLFPFDESASYTHSHS